MSDHTIKNFTELDDVAGERSGGNVEARFGRSAIESEHIGVSLFRYAPNFRSPLGHRHREQEEVYVVVSGSGRVKLGDEVRDIREWDVIRVAPPVARAFEAGPEGLGLVVVGSDRPEGGDGEMIHDFWTD